MTWPRVLLVTDPSFGDDIIVDCVRRAASALPRGALGVQLRDKRRAAASLRVFAGQLRRITKMCGAMLFVNGDARLARDIGADGVHLGGGSGSDDTVRVTLGRSARTSRAAHSDDDVRLALARGADAVLVSPIFPTRSPSPQGESKRPRGVDAIRSAKVAAGGRLFVYALGGVTVATTPACVVAGADGVALVRGLLESVDASRTARAIHDAFERRWYA